MLLVSCVGTREPASELVFGEVAGGDRASSIAAFSQTVQPLAVKNCGQCHGDGGNQSPQFALTNSEAAYDAVINSGKVDLSNPDKSRLVQRLSTDRHNCWGDCSDNGAEMKAAIEKWSELAVAPTGAVGKFRTNSKLISSAIETVAKTENGVLMLQAEDGELEGRMKKFTNSRASNFTYISGSLIGRHPFGDTVRTGEVTQNCETVTSSDLSDSVNGPFIVREQRRVLGDDTHSRYTMRLNAKIIHPNKRNEFLARIKSGNVEMSDLANNGFFLKEGLEDSDDEEIDGDRFIVLPDLVRLGDFLSNSSINQDKNFFAPRFGELGTGYYTGSYLEFMNGLDNDQKQQVMFKLINDRFLDYFYNSNGTPENNIREIPFSLRRLPDGTQYNRSAAHADQFYEMYFGMTYQDALTDLGNGIKKIDTYLYYYIDPDSRSTDDETQNYYDANGSQIGSKREVFDFNRGQKRLDLNNLFTGKNSTDPRTIYKANYAQTLHPIVQNSCKGCHGSGGGLPQHSSDNLDVAYDAMAANINFTTPANSLPVTKMNEGHNCGALCLQLAQMMTDAIVQWRELNKTELAAATENNQTGFESLPMQERIPGRAKYKFRVTEAGSYNVWLKVMTTDNNLSDFNVRILDDMGRPVPNCEQDESCPVNEQVYAGKSESQIDGMGCRRFRTGEHPEWSWYTRGRDDVNQRVRWNLGEGEFTLEVVERSVGAKLDLIAISKNPSFNPAENLVDEGFISDIRPRVLKFDLSQQLGAQGAFEIEVKEPNDESYMFRNPRFTGNAKNIIAKDLKLLMNENYEFSNSTYNELNVVAGTDGERLALAPLVAVKMFGENSDKVAFAFEQLGFTESEKSIIRPDEPAPILGRVCRRVDIFENTVKPIVSGIRLMRKYSENNMPGYQGYTDEYPGRRADTIDHPTLYTCTSCHNEEHIYFKMTSYIDDSQTLCDQALSRVDFANFRRSLLLRGLNGTFNHPKLHFIQDIPVTGSGENVQLRKNSNRAFGYDGTWIGDRFETYQNGTDFNLGDHSGENREYLEKFVGQLKVVRYQRVNDPFHPLDGEILTSNFNKGTYDPTLGTYVNFKNDGINRVSTVSPVNFLNNKEALDPEDITDEAWFKVKDSCIANNGTGMGFTESNGLFYDPCNNNVEVGANFERVKEKYRELIIEWMKAEKAAFEAAQGN